MCKYDKKMHSNLFCLKSDRQKRCESSQKRRENRIFLNKIHTLEQFLLARGVLIFISNNPPLKGGSSLWVEWLSIHVCLHERTAFLSMYLSNIYNNKSTKSQIFTILVLQNGDLTTTDQQELEDGELGCYKIWTVRFGRWAVGVQIVSNWLWLRPYTKYRHRIRILLWA